MKNETSVLYHNEDDNIYIEFTIDKRKDVLLEFQFSQYNQDKPRAPKGWTRSLVCQIIDFFIKEKITKKTARLELVAGDIAGTTGKKHDQKKLNKMYKDMGFRDDGENNFSMTITKFKKWCQKNYADLYFELDSELNSE